MDGQVQKSGWATMRWILISVLLLGHLGCSNQGKTDKQSRTAQLEPAQGEAADSLNPSTSIPSHKANVPAPGAGQSSAGPRKPPSLSRDVLEQASYQVPNGGPAELLAFLKQMGQRQQESADKYELGKIQDARIQAADRLESQAADAQTRQVAVQNKLESLQTLDLLGATNAKQRLIAACQQYATDSDPRVAEMAKWSHAQSLTSDFLRGILQDFHPVVQHLSALTQAYPNSQSLAFGMQGLVRQLFHAGRRQEAVTVLQAVAEPFANSHVAEVSSVGRVMKTQLRLEQLGFDQAVFAVLNQQQGAAETLVRAAQTAVADRPVSVAMIQEIYRAARVLELTHHYNLSGQVYQSVRVATADLANKEAAARVDQAVLRGLTRIGLIGKPLQLDVVTLDGQAVDWAAYRGKIVLLTFSALSWLDDQQTWGTVSHIYDKYRDRGFEVLAVNLLDRPEVLRNYFATRNPPFPIVVGRDNNAQASNGPLASQLGVDGPPYSLLVDSQGTVVALHPSGQQALEDRVAQMLGIQAPTTAGRDQATRQ